MLSQEITQEIYDNSFYSVGFINSFSNESLPPQKINEITALGAGAASYLFINNLPLENMKLFTSKSA